MTGMVGFISLVLDIGMLIVGVWALVKGSIPARLLKSLLGAGDYRTDARTARMFGFVLVVPIIVFILTVASTAAASAQAAIIFSIIHLIVLIIVVLTVVIWARQIRNVNKAAS